MSEELIIPIEEEKPKKKKGKKALRIIAIIVAVILVFCSATTMVTIIGDNMNKSYAASFDEVTVTDQLTPVKDADGYWTFTTDRDFKVMQLTDVHLGGGWMSLSKDKMALNAIAAMVTAEKPDLVIVTGDIVYPVPFQAGTFNNLQSTKIFAELMETLGVYWTICFGNHDTEVYSYYSRETLSNFYSSEELTHCLFERGPTDIDGYGNQIIKVKNSEGIVSRAFVIFDSHSYINGDFMGIKWQYDNIHQNQIDWYSAEINKLTAANQAVDVNQGAVKSLAFFHIPLAEYKTAYDGYIAAGSQDTADIDYFYGIAGETGKIVFSGVGEDNLFETMSELGSTQGIFCGHDHLNNFSIEYKGIRLTYGMSIDYLAYKGISKLGAQRGCTVITTTDDGDFTCKSENYYQDKYPSKYEKETVTDL